MPEGRTISTAGVLLAAGRSTRMGGPSKLLSDFRGKPLARWAAEALAASGLDEVVAVLGREPDGIRSALSGLPVRCVLNPRYADGMSTSLAAGVRALDPDVEFAVVALGDMPLLRPEVVRKLLAEMQSSGRSIALPVHGGRRGHPVVFDLRVHRQALLALTGDQGARAVLAARSEEVLEVAVDDPGVLLDVDTAEDLKTLAEEACAERGGADP